MFFERSLSELVDFWKNSLSLLLLLSPEPQVDARTVRTPDLFI